MNKETKNKLIEVCSFCACLIVLLGIAYFSGVIKGFAPQDFTNAYNELFSNFSNSAFVRNNNVSISKTQSRGSKNSAAYNNYQIARIPESVLRGVNNTGAWTQIFNSYNKSIFYIYDEKNDVFDNSIKNYVASDTQNSYSVHSYSKNEFNNLRVGDIGPSKICDSLQECNKVRQKASDYSSMAEFLKYCGNTLCIINPAKKEYVKVKSRQSATKVLNDLKNW